MENGVLRQGVEQLPFLLRAIYFVLIGWWMCGFWMAIGWALLLAGSLTLVLIPLTYPIAFWLYGRVGAVTTLYRS